MLTDLQAWQGQMKLPLLNICSSYQKLCCCCRLS
jgi:hypothetical protein